MRPTQACAQLTVIIPAFNEEGSIGRTLRHVEGAKGYLQVRSDVAVEVIMVDNGSSDTTARVAAAAGARVVHESERNIARARNVGARAAHGQILVFLDADTTFPEGLLWRVVDEMADPRCLGGAADTEYKPASQVIHAYLQLWRWLGKLTKMAQGAAQFCRREVFEQLGGYDETLFMGEDVDFHWRLRRLAKKRGLRAVLLNDVRVIPSCRRFDQWPLWRTLIWTNPLVILAFRRRNQFWDGWYSSPPRENRREGTR